MAVVSIVRGATKFDPAGIDLAFACRCTAAVAFVLLLGLAAHQPLDGVSAAFGAVLAGFASRQGIYRTRAAVMLATASGMAFSAAVACATSQNVVLSVVLLGVWGLALGLVSVLGSEATSIATNSTIALIICSHPPYGPSQALVQPLCILFGGAVQTVLLVAVWPLHRYTVERRALAAAYRALAAYARDIPEEILVSPGTTTLTDAGGTLADPQPFAARGELGAFKALYDEAERIRASLGALATDRHLLAREKHDGAVRALRAIGGRSAAVLDEIAAALIAERSPLVGNETHAALGTALTRLEREAASARGAARNDAEQALADARTLRAELRNALNANHESAAPPLTGRLPGTSGGEALRHAGTVLRANLDAQSIGLRHSLRLAFVMLVAGTLEHVLPLQRAYWIPLTTVIVLRPDFSTTFTRGAARVAGTVLGAVLAALIALFHPGTVTDTLLALAFAGIAYALFAASFLLFSAAVTCYVVFLLALGGASTEDTAAIDRVAATLAGGVLALLAYLAWPTWSREHVSSDLGELVDAQRESTAAVLAGFVSGNDAERLRGTQMKVWRALTVAEGAVEQLKAEPVRARTLSVATAVAILRAVRRWGAASLTLRSRSARVENLEAPAFALLADELDASMRNIADALRSRTLPDPLPSLRAAQAELARAARNDERAGLRALVSETGLMVDAAEEMIAALVLEFAGRA